MPKPRLLIISKVLPFPREAGQQQRVFYKIRALRDSFQITFLTSTHPRNIESLRNKILEYCDDAIVLPSRYEKNTFTKFFFSILGLFYSLKTGLKKSNYIIGKIDFSSARIKKATDNGNWDCVLFEYWHSVECAGVFKERGIPTVLDTHDLLWKSLERQLLTKKHLPEWWKIRVVRKYKQREENAWNRYDALIAINADEFNYIRNRVRSDIHVFYAPMGTDLSLWSYSFQPRFPQRVGYYGGLGSPHNQKDAFDCYKEILPILWTTKPDVEYWIIGSNPPDFIQALAKEDKRVVVTGFLENVQEVLNTLSVVICPWTGTYGFRSRLVEVMSLGVPVVATPDAVSGMGMEVGRGIYLQSNNTGIANEVLNLLQNNDLLVEQSNLARKQVEEKFSYEATYKHFVCELLNFLNKSH